MGGRYVGPRLKGIQRVCAWWFEPAAAVGFGLMELRHTDSGESGGGEAGKHQASYTDHTTLIRLTCKRWSRGLVCEASSHPWRQWLSQFVLKTIISHLKKLLPNQWEADNWVRMRAVIYSSLLPTLPLTPPPKLRHWRVHWHPKHPKDFFQRFFSSVALFGRVWPDRGRFQTCPDVDETAPVESRTCS